MKGRWEMLTEGGRLSAALNWTTTPLPSLAAAYFVLPLSLLTPRLSFKKMTAMQVLICREAWTNQSPKLRLTVKASNSLLSALLSPPTSPESLLTICCLNFPPSLPPSLSSLYFNLSEKWKGRPLNLIASRKLWQVFIVVLLFLFNLSAGGLGSWHLYIWRPALKLPLTPLDELHCDLRIPKHPWQIFLIDTLCNRDQP